jgi:hypothetical protein
VKVDPAQTFLTPDELRKMIAEVLKVEVSLKTLANWRSSTSAGPTFVRVAGQPRYRLSDVQVWLKKRVS